MLLVCDLEERSPELERIILSDFDRVSGVLRLRSLGGELDPVKLGQETMRAFYDHMLHRQDKEPALFVDGEGKPLAKAELHGMISQIAHRSGLEFEQASFRFRVSRSDQGPRLVAKGASRDYSTSTA